MSTLEVLDLRARRRGLQFASRIDADVPELLIGDSSRLQQIVVNPVANAIAFRRANVGRESYKTGSSPVSAVNNGCTLVGVRGKISL